MKTKLFTLCLLSVAVAGAGAQSLQAGAADTTAPAPAATAAPNKIIYGPRLPSAVELTNAAKAQGLTVERIEQTATQVMVVYKSADGLTNTVAYQLLTSPPPVPSAAPPQAQAGVEYVPVPRVYYYDGYGPDYYYPAYWYPPVSLRLGLGFGFRGGGFHGGFGFRHR